MSERVTQAFVKGQKFEARDDEGTFYFEVRSTNKREGTATIRSQSRGTVVGTARRRRFIPWERVVKLDRVSITPNGSFAIGGSVTAKVSSTSKPDAPVEFERVKRESDEILGTKLYRVLLDGEEIGWVESHTQTATHKIAGTRLVRSGGQETYWTAALTRSDLNSREGRLGYQHDTRKRAVEVIVEARERRAA